MTIHTSCASLITAATVLRRLCSCGIGGRGHLITTLVPPRSSLTRYTYAGGRLALPLALRLPLRLPLRLALHLALRLALRSSLHTILTLLDLLRPSRAYSKSSSCTPIITVTKRRTQITSQPLVPLPPIPHRHMQRGIAIPIPDVDIACVVAEDGLEHVGGCVLNTIYHVSSAAIDHQVILSAAESGRRKGGGTHA